jgi:hypothetical protein
MVSRAFARSGTDNGRAALPADIPLIWFDRSIVQHSNIERFPGRASTDMISNLQNPENPLPYDPIRLPKKGRFRGGG